MSPTAVAAAAVVVAVIIGVIVCLWMILRFLWKIYERGGPSHVGSVAKALRQVYDPMWPARALRRLPAVEGEQKKA